MPTDDDDADDDYVAPLPPDDRLWRHPSEMGSEGDTGAGAPQIVLVSKSGPALGRTVLVAGLAGLIGALATLGVIVGTDAFVRERQSASPVQKYSEGPRAPGESELEIADGVLPSVARVEAVGGPYGVVNSTAVVFRSDGHLITTADAVDAAESITVHLNDGTSLDATLVSRSIPDDVAVLKIDRTDLPVAVVSQERTEFGDQPIMIDASNPNRGPEIFISLVTKESTRVENGTTTSYGLIQTTTRAVSARSAGTILVDDGGSVIGLISSRAEGRATGTAAVPVTNGAKAPDEANALHFAQPADFLWDIATQLTDTGQILRPWIGLRRGQDLTADEAEENDLAGGVTMSGVDSGSPAALAKIRQGDIVRGINDVNILGYNDLVVATRSLKPGDQVTVFYLRDGEEFSPTLTVAARAEAP